MKVNVNLGVASKKSLLDHRSCFEVGNEVRKIQDGLAFARFMLNGTKPLDKKDLSIISAGINTTANEAERFVGNPQISVALKSMATSLAGSAKTLNNHVGEYLIGKDGQRKLKASLGKLEKKVEALKEDARKLCNIEKRKAKLAGAPSFSRAHMGMSSTPTLAEPSVMSPKPYVEAAPLKKYVYPTFRRPALHKTIKSFRRIP